MVAVQIPAHNNKEKMLSIGTYPDVTLKFARKLRDVAADQLQQGVDPSQVVGMSRQLR